MTDRVDYLMPNWDTDPAFGEALKRALLSGVHATALTFSFDGRALHYKERIPILLSPAAEDTAKKKRKMQQGGTIRDLDLKLWLRSLLLRKRMFG